MDEERLLSHVLTKSEAGLASRWKLRLANGPIYTRTAFPLSHRPKSHKSITIFVLLIFHYSCNQLAMYFYIKSFMLSHNILCNSFLLVL